jgi:hypothetical protein
MPKTGDDSSTSDRPLPMTPTTPGKGGVPLGRRSDDLGTQPAGGRHRGALLQDPETTLERLERPKRPQA